MIELLDPTQSFGAKKLEFSPRPTDLRGKRIGLIENTKVNAAEFLKRIGERLVKEHGAETYKVYRKKHASTPAHEGLIDEIKSECDIVISGIGDCGSCSSATVLDGIMMEQIGLPSVSIVTKYFVNTGRAMAKQWGLPDYEFIYVEHPTANLDSEELDGRVDDALEKILDQLFSHSRQVAQGASQ